MGNWKKKRQVKRENKLFGPPASRKALLLA